MQYYQNPPHPFSAAWRQSPIPGWAANPAIVGPRTVGIGAITAGIAKNMMVSKLPSATAMTDPAAIATPGTFPWIYVFAGVAVVGAAGLFAYKKGYLGHRR